MLRYDRQIKPGLVALYIQPGNGAGLFLQPWSLHGAEIVEATFLWHALYTKVRFFHR